MMQTFERSKTKNKAVMLLPGWIRPVGREVLNHFLALHLNIFFDTSGNLGGRGVALLDEAK